MEVDIKVPKQEGVGEVATVVKWIRNEGDEIIKDEPLVLLEFPKAEVEVSSPSSGRLGRILVKEGRMVRVDDTLGFLTT